MLAICGNCHSPSFAAQQLAQRDEMIRQADHLMAEAIRIVAALYQALDLPVAARILRRFAQGLDPIS